MFPQVARRSLAATAVVAFAVMFAAVQLAAAQQVVVRAASVGRLPRVYNALISSDQNLLPSKADPIVSPVVMHHVFRFAPFFYNWPAVAPAYVDASPAETRQQSVVASNGVVASNAVVASDAVTASNVDASEVRDDASKVQSDASEADHHRPTTTVVKNYRPADSSVPDVPPPPLPVGKKNKKKPEEYPPAPVYAIWIDRGCRVTR